MDREDYYKLKSDMCGKIIRDVEVHNESFFTKAYIELLLEDPETGKRTLSTLTRCY